MTIERPLVSIVTTSLNSAEYLPDLIAAVEAQTYQNIEHLMVDGVSTDGTVDLIRQYAERRRVLWVSEPDDGAADATSKGLRMATGDIVIVVPSDDLIFPWSIETAVNYFHDHPDVDVVHGDSIASDLATGAWSLRLHKRFTFGYLARTQSLALQATYFRSHVIAGQEEQDRSLQHAPDYDWLLRLTRDRKVVNIQEFLAIFRKRPGAINHREGISDDVVREANIARSRYIRASGPVHRVMVTWDRIYGAIHRRIQIFKLIKYSRRVGPDGAGLQPHVPWRQFLAAYSISSSSGLGLLTTLLPGRHRYPLDIWSRPNAESLGAAERPNAHPTNEG